MRIKVYIYIIILLIFLNKIESPGFDSLNNYVIYPQKNEPYKLSPIAVGISLGKLPRFIVDDQINQSPLINVLTNFTLPYNFYLSAKLQSIYLTNYFISGLNWAFHYGNFSLSAGDNFAYMYAIANLEAFDVSVNGWFNHPTLTLGYKIGDLAVSLQSEMSIVTSLHKKVGNIEVQQRKNQIIGYAWLLSLEQPLWKNNYVMLGIKMNYAKYFYQSWLAFSPQEVYLYIPEFMLCFLF